MRAPGEGGAYDAGMIVPPPARPAGEAKDAGPSAFLVGAAFVPIGFAVVLALVAPGFYAPLVDERAGILGQPPLIPFAGALLGLLVVDLLVLFLVRSSFVQGLVMALSTTAGVFLVILAPAVIQIALNLDGVVD